ncbi:MAG: tetratricopeptide repeat protein [Betaproteobacteria bacterium]|nr:tetratricopeptide repeat protein [Betaproteobacteria bacterium]MDH5220543.1 tetratricopeptide repeat protein [Betaproteobacteria bacterium]MDH5350806.1 tetratricopeptide repeat protein [Betaproteobacteria bacterium]
MAHVAPGSLLERLFGMRGRKSRRLLALGKASEQAGRLEEARDRYRAAVAAAPTHAAHLNLGIVLEALGDPLAAAQEFDSALALEPGEPFASYNLGRLLYTQGALERAESLLRAALRGRAAFPEALVVMASVLEARGELAQAASTLQQAIGLRPDYAGALRNLGMLLCRLERWSEALPVLRRALEADAADADALYWLGNALIREARPEEALTAYRSAAAQRPTFAEAWCNLGNLLCGRGSLDEAGRCLQKALELKPDYADAHVGMGNVLGASQRPEDAEQCFRRGIALDPAIAQAHVNLGIVLWQQGSWREAIESCRAAIALSPGAPEARWALAMCHLPAVREPGDDLPGVRARFAEQLGELERWFDAGRSGLGPLALGVAQPFWLAYQDELNRELLERYGRLCARLMQSWQAGRAPRPVAQRAPGALRVGVVSQYFRSHSVWSAIIKGWFRQLDPRRFALNAFCLGAHEDAETRYARSRAARFEQGHLGLERWVEVIADAQPDVLIYPEIGMDPMSLKLASLRLAPVQAASWGHPETTGLPTIDYFFSAAGLEPPGAEANYSERLVRLPNLGCWVEPEAAQARPPDLEAWGIEPGVPLLLCPGSPFKYAPERDRVLAEIARRLGRCRMLFFTHRTGALSRKLEARLRAAFAAHGVQFERCARFVPWQERDAFYGLLECADVYLDTLGFSGFNTALQAIQCGLPVVALEGGFLRGRLASGILRRIGLEELVVANEAQYVELALRLAGDPGYRDAVRARIVSRRDLLFGDAAPIRALEDFLEGAAA